MKRKQINLLELILLLELPSTSLNWVKLDYRGALDGLRELKKTLKGQRRKLALKHHPDRGGGDGERMKTINEAIDILLALRIQPPQRQVVVFRSFMGGTSGVSTASTTTSTGCW